MSVIVEDGSIVANSNSYVSETDLTAFATARGVTLSGDEEELLIQAMDYIESLSYKGLKKTRDQSLQWPRSGVYIDSYYLDNDVIPEELKKGLMQTAIAIDTGVGPQVTLGRKTKREKVGELEVEYEASSVTNSLDVKIKGFLWKLLNSGGMGSNVINVNKA
jgi:hypothetical protein